MSLPKSLRTRSVTAILFGLITLGLIIINQWTYLIFILLVTFFCSYEWSAFFLKKPSSLWNRIFYPLVISLPLLILTLWSNPSYFYLSLGVLFIPVLINLFDPASTKRSLLILSSGTIYISIPLIIAYKAGFIESEYNFSLILYPLLLIWSNDVFAYLIGSMLGRRKLYPKVSPNKTWEGTIGGILMATIVALFLGKFWMELSWLSSGIFGIGVGVLATLGDLFESSIKRSFEIKDSSRLLPGHGGFLDRFDSFLLVMPFSWIYWQIIFA